MGDDWFARRTYDAATFDLASLTARKAADQITVSVVLPARDEADTIAGVVEAAVHLRGTLVDEVVVVDAGSTDDTVHLAEQAGATVVQDRGLLPEAGEVLGKGDALWRSLSATTGDLVVFVDADIRNPHPRFVSGLLGPLLTDPQLQLVKAFYDRPLAHGETLHPTGGGRVTELLARPLINLLWPSLAGLVQPLSGEYGGRRQHLEAIPFFTGYGVEFGLLVDTLTRAGVDALAQVDLAERVHRNQSIDALSRMAFGILQVAMRRLRAEGRLTGPELPEAYLQFERAVDGVVPDAHHVAVVERPPLAAYR